MSGWTEHVSDNSKALQGESTRVYYLAEKKHGASCQRNKLQSGSEPKIKG